VDGRAYVNALVERRIAPLQLIHEAFTTDSELVTLSGRLVALGIAADQLIAALSSVMGLPVAPAERLSHPDISGIEPGLVAELRNVGAVPFGRDEQGVVDVAVISPEGHDALKGMNLPPHRIHVALEQDAIGAFRAVQKALTAPPTADLTGSHARFGRDVSVDTLSGGIQGKLDSLSLLEVSKLLQKARRDAEVQIALPDGATGEVFVSRGRITRARSGGLEGEPAFHDLATHSDGSFAIFYDRRAEQPNCDRAVDDLVAEAVERRQRSALAAGPRPISFETPPSAPAPAAAAPRPISLDLPGIPVPPTSSPAMAAPAAAPAPRAPRRRVIAGYEVYGELGRGAHGVVYRVRRPGSEEDLALKVIDAAGRDRKHFEMRVNRELKVQAELRHRNIVSVFEFGPFGDEFYLVTECLPRGTLADKLDEVGTLPTAIIARIVSDLIWGLDHAHERGVVHRDLKPGNLLLAEDGLSKIGDFGLAHSDLDPNKSTAGAIVGTPVYMSPEQAMGTGRDHRCDIFTIGTLLYEMVSGDNPFARMNDPLSLMAVVQVQRPMLLERSPEAHPLLHDIVELVQKADPDARPDTVAAVHSSLQPLVSASMRRYPDLMKTFVEDPARACLEARADEARLELKRARAMLSEGTAFVAPAALAVMRATRLAPDDADARELLGMIEQRWNYHMGGPELAATKEMAKKIADEPKDAELAREVARRCREEGALESARSALERVVLLLPDDKDVRTELELLAGTDRRAPFIAGL
jgi:hypothetical protein